MAPTLISGLHALAHEYDGVICDVWGVIHDGHKPYRAAAEALRRFREKHGKVVLLSNAPRPPAEIEKQLDQIGFPRESYDAIVTSGGATREELARRSTEGRLDIFHLGPPRDSKVYDGLANVNLVAAEKAALVLCTGLFNDDTETPETYHDMLADLAARRLTLICANPDILVPRGGRLVWCAGALARIYERAGGQVLYYGKPHAPIYKSALLAAGAPKRPLAIGDGLETDIRGANAAGIDALFIADGVHGAEIGPLTPENMQAAFTRANVTALGAMPALAW